MANTQYVTANRLTKEAWYAKKLIFIIGIPIVMAIVFLFHQLWWLLLLFLMVPFLDIGTIYKEGAKGEDSTLAILSSFPDSYTVFNQVEIPVKGLKTGVVELDFIVIGPNGIFIVEVKNNNSTIQGSEEAGEWIVNKVGRGGTPYKKAIRNPAKQLKRQVWALSNFLKERNHKVWVEGIVYFSNPNSRLLIEGTPSVKIIHQDGLIEYIQSFKTNVPPQNIEGIVKNLALLKCR